MTLYLSDTSTMELHPISKLLVSYLISDQGNSRGAEKVTEHPVHTSREGKRQRLPSSSKFTTFKIVSSPSQLGSGSESNLKSN